VYDDTGTTLSSDAIPTLPPVLADFTGAQLDLTGCLDAEVVGLSCAPPASLAVHAMITTVPEPRAGLLALGALGALVSCARAARRFR